MGRRGLVALSAWLALAPAADSPSRDDYRAPLRANAAELTLGYLEGRYRMPVTCTRPDGSQVALEEAVVLRLNPDQGTDILQATFFGVADADVVRCFNPTFQDIPDRRGTLYVTYTAQHRSDVGARDFQREMRDGVVELPVRSGVIHVKALGSQAGEPRVVRLGGRRETLEVRSIVPGSDGHKLLARYADPKKEEGPPLRKFELRITGSEGLELHGYFAEDLRRRRKP